MRNIMFVVLVMVAGCAQADYDPSGYTPRELEVRHQFVLDCVHEMMSDPKIKNTGQFTFVLKLCNEHADEFVRLFPNGVPAGTKSEKFKTWR